MPYTLPQKLTNLSVVTVDLYLILVMPILLLYPNQAMERITLDIYLLSGSPKLFMRLTLSMAMVATQMPFLSCR